MTDDPQALLERVAAEEAEIVFERFDLDDAWRLGARMRAAAAAASLPVVIGVTHGEARVFHTALRGSSADNDAWLDRKTRVARRYGRSSFGVGLSFRAAGKSFDTDARLDTTRYAAHGGVFPITITGVGVVGTAGVSGLPQADDHAFVVAQLRAYQREQRVVTAGAPVVRGAATDPSDEGESGVARTASTESDTVPEPTAPDPSAAVAGGGSSVEPPTPGLRRRSARPLN